jgi:hypothetical protein
MCRALRAVVTPLASRSEWFSWAPRYSRTGGANLAEGGGSNATVTLPSGEEVPNPWRLLAAMVGRATGSESLNPVAFVEDEETDTQVRVLSPAPSLTEGKRGRARRAGRRFQLRQ